VLVAFAQVTLPVITLFPLAGRSHHNHPGPRAAASKYSKAHLASRARCNQRNLSAGRAGGLGVSLSDKNATQRHNPSSTAARRASQQRPDERLSLHFAAGRFQTGRRVLGPWKGSR
jgi:hypothetical protein